MHQRCVPRGYITTTSRYLRNFDLLSVDCLRMLRSLDSWVSVLPRSLRSLSVFHYIHIYFRKYHSMLVRETILNNLKYNHSKYSDKQNHLYRGTSAVLHYTYHTYESLRRILVRKFNFGCNSEE